VSEGNLVVLFFDKLQVLHLINHAEASPEHRPTYFETTAGPALWLVGDKGIYLMSNGAPAMLANGELDASGGQKPQRLFAMRKVAIGRTTQLNTGGPSTTRSATATIFLSLSISWLTFAT
jgi:hypothetical protein